MISFIIVREQKAEGGGYVTFKAAATEPFVLAVSVTKHDDGNESVHKKQFPAGTIIAAASFWPRTQSAYLWTRQAYLDQMTGVRAAVSRAPIYNTTEEQVRDMVEREASS